ncbi:MAG: hypothetical protein KJT03_12775 [Verrucomicrobiae bacterium]|nr:hypothetical protein [Verrucomicrobiae bacterium]
MWGDFASADPEPIPDFGPEGPAGVERHFEAVLPESQAFNRSAQSQGRLQGFRFILSRLDVSAGQQAEIKQIFESYVEKGNQLRNDISRTQDTLKAVRKGGSEDTDLTEVRLQLLILTKQSRSLQTDLRQKILAVLTSEQADKLNRIESELRQRADRGKRS